MVASTSRLRPSTPPNVAPKVFLMFLRRVPCTRGLQSAGHFGPALGVKAFAHEAIDVGTTDFDGRGEHDLLVKRGQEAAVLKDDIRTPLGLVNAPVEAVAKTSVHGDPFSGH